MDAIIVACVAIAEGRGFLEDRDIWDRLPNHVKVNICGNNGGGGGSNDMLLEGGENE